MVWKILIYDTLVHRWRLANDGENGTLPGIASGRCSMRFHSTLFADIRCFTLPIDHLLVSSGNETELRISLVNLFFRFILASSTLVLLCLHAILDSLSSARVLIGSAFPRSISNVGKL